MERRLVVSALLLAPIGLLIGCDGDDVTGTNGDGGPPAAFEWTVRAALPVPRTDLGVAVVDGKVYVLGGFSGSTLARVDAYEPATDAWTRKADMPTARRSFAVGVLNGKIYVAAGMSWTDPNAVTYITATEEYDPTTDTWTSRAPCPLDPAFNSVFGNMHMSGGAGNGRLYVVVFNTNTPGLSATYEYDPGTDSWTSKAPVPFTYSQFVSTTLNGKLYVFASNEEGGRLADYDPIGNVWVIRAPLPEITLPGLLGAKGKVYAVGGVTADGAVTDAVYEYDPATDRWARSGRLNVARHSSGAAELAGRVYVMGGASSASFSATPLSAVEQGIPN